MNFLGFKNELLADKNALHQRKHQARLLQKQVCQKHVVVVQAYAVVDPGTMVVKPIDAHVTGHTVSTPAGADDLAVRAQRSGIKGLQQLHELDAVVVNVAWIPIGH
jgi:hypothetical protein